MKNVRVGMSVLAAIMLVAASASAATTWTGTNSNVWTDGGNWDAGLPGDAVITGFGKVAFTTIGFN